jgi:hypothetical protein
LQTSVDFARQYRVELHSEQAGMATRRLTQRAPTVAQFFVQPFD